MKGALPINIAKTVIAVIIYGIYVIIFTASLLYRRIILMWRWRRVKKAGANMGKYINDFFSNLPPRESEFCKDCTHSEVSKNNGNLLCLNERSRRFGTAVSPENDEMGFCYSKRTDNDIDSAVNDFEQINESKGVQNAVYND